MLLCHITSQVEGREHDSLLSEIGGNYFPYIVAMDSSGKVLALLEGERTVETFRGLMKTGKEFIELGKKADAGDAPAKVEYFLRALKLNHFKLAEAQKFRETLKDVQADQKARIDAMMVTLEVKEAFDPLRKNKDRAKVPDLKAEVGRKLWAMHQGGRIPGEDRPFGDFYSFIIEFAEKDKNIPAFETALKALQERLGDKLRKPWLDAKTEILNRLKAEKEAPKEDKKEGEKK